MDRRHFLVAASGSLIAACTGPQNAAVAPPVAARPPVPRSTGVAGPVRKRILVLVELQGGNDGLNTVIPIADADYRRLRGGLAIDAKEALDVESNVAFHPALKPLVDPLERGELAVLHSVGYPKPNRSHFRSIEIWDQATASDRYGDEGWVTQALRGHPEFSTRDADADAIVLGVGNIGPLAGPDTRLVTMREPRQFLAQAESMRNLDARRDATPALRHLVRTQNEAVAAADAVRRKLSGRARFNGRFGGDPLARSLAIAADLIADGIDIPVWKVTLSGFDTHADQRPRHARLLANLANALAAFRGSMQELGRWNDTLVATYSEFGRRVGENLSRGTDHGTAAPLFVLGGAVDGGFKGPIPNLADLDEGDLKAKLDFRQVYASVVADWWGQRDNFLVRQGHQPLTLVRAANA
jgi:uncharacterized protein (DUF1501 family)